MNSETSLRLAFIILLAALFSMRIFFMIRIRRSGGRIMPGEKAIEREGGNSYFILRVVSLLLLVTFLVMYIAGMKWIGFFAFPLADWLRWTGFVVGIFSIAFWTWTQGELDTQWSAQLQLTKDHHLVTTGPYSKIRHPLYLGMFGWCLSLSLLTANWIFAAIFLLTILGILRRIPQEEQMMIEAFGEEYEQYIQRTGRFFPRLKSGGK